MKQTVKYQNLSIAGKLRVETKLIIDDKGYEYISNYEGNITTSINLFPIITISIIRIGEIDDNGNRIKAPWNPNDILNMTKFTLPVLVNELTNIQQEMKIPNLYTYQGTRLELNEEVAQNTRHVFMIGTNTLELTAVVIVTDEHRIEGIKMKFNNEQSSVLLTLNELNSLLYNLNNLSIDSLVLSLYLNYINKPEPNKPIANKGSDIQIKLPIVDILEKKNDAPF